MGKKKTFFPISLNRIFQVLSNYEDLVSFLNSHWPDYISEEVVVGKRLIV